MILGDPAFAVKEAQHERGVAIDEIFRHAAARRPDAVALVDPPNRQAFTDGPPRRLTYAQADRMVSAIAGRLRGMGLPTDSMVGIQMPNIVENVLTILGVLRAGLIAAPLPLLWRRSEAAAALARAGVKALITCARAGGFDYARVATYIAADVFPIRYVCGFGPNLPDGVVAFDDLFAATEIDPMPALERDRQGDGVAHVAVVTFDVGEDGPLPVARNHLELLAGGLGVFLEGRLEPGAAILSTIAPASFCGICLALLPWLFTGGTLALHHPFDAAVLAKTRRDERCGVMVLPAPVAFRLAETGLFAGAGPTTILAAWHSPERLAGSADWREHEAVLVDVPIFGEAGLLAMRRGAGGQPAPLALGAVLAPRDGQDRQHGAIAIAEIAATAAGSVAMRGPMVPHYPYPAGVAETDQPHFAIGPDGFVDTGYGCRVDAATGTLAITGTPAGVVGVGGYRFALRVLLEAIGRIDGTATLAAIPDPLSGQRLVGTAADCAALKDALDAAGCNPSVAAAVSAPAARTLRRAAGGG